MNNFTAFCRETQTDPELQTLLRTGWEQWYSTTDDDIQLSIHDFSPRLHRIINQQDRIGWRQLFNGRFGTEWSRVQQNAYDRHQQGNDTHFKRTGEQWQVQLIGIGA